MLAQCQCLKGYIGRDGGRTRTRGNGGRTGRTDEDDEQEIKDIMKLTPGCDERQRRVGTAGI